MDNTVPEDLQAQTSAVSEKTSTVIYSPSAHANSVSSNHIAQVNTCKEQCIFPAWKEWALVSIICWTLLAVFFYPAFFQGKLIYSGSDLLSFNAPRCYIQAQSLLDGEIPQWEQLIGSGFTVQAEGQANCFSPLTVWPYLFLPITAATNLVVFLAIYLAFCGSYWLAKVYGARPPAALLAAVAYALGGTYIFRICHLNIIHVMAWFPIGLTSVHLYLHNGERRWIILTTIAWTFQLLSGHPQIAYISQLAYWLYAVITLIQIHYCRNNTAKRTGTPTVCQALGSMVMAGILTLLLGALYWMPLYEMTQYSDRSASIAEDTLRAGSFANKFLQTLINPYAFDNVSPNTPDNQLYNTNSIPVPELHPYFGILPLILAITAICKCRHSRYLALLIPIAVFYCLALGTNSSFFVFCHSHIPLLSKFRTPGYFLIPVELLFSVLIALGADVFFAHVYSQSKKLAYIALALCFLATGYDLYNVNAKFQEYLPAEWCQPPATLQLLGSEHHRIYAPLAYGHWVVQESKLPWTQHSQGLAELFLELPNDIAAIWDIETLSDHCSDSGGINNRFYWYLYQFLNSSIYHIGCPDSCRAHGLTPQILQILRLLDISHIVSLTPMLTEENRSLLEQTAYQPEQYPGLTLYVYELKGTLPPARLVDKLRLGTPQLFTQNKHHQPCSDPNGLYEANLEQPQNLGTCRVTKQTRNTLELDTEYEKESMLILARAYHPNWKAQIDDASPQDIFRVDLALQGIKVPAGKHHITMRYISPAWNWGWKISLAGLFILLGWGIVGKGKNRIRLILS